MIRLLTTLLAIFCTVAVAFAADPIKPVPEDVLSAWGKAGAKLGWCGINPKGGIVFRPSKEELGKDCVLVLQGFEITNWPTDGLSKLPSPGVPFGLRIPGITDAQAKEVAALKHLTHLSIASSKITDEGVAALAAHEDLTSLNICYTKVTDTGVKQFAGTKKLTRLDMRGTLATDESVKELSKCQNLVMLAVGDSKISDRGVDELKRALPKCDVKN